MVDFYEVKSQNVFFFYTKSQNSQIKTCFLFNVTFLDSMYSSVSFLLHHFKSILWVVIQKENLNSLLNGTQPCCRHIFFTFSRPLTSVAYSLVVHFQNWSDLSAQNMQQEHKGTSILYNHDPSWGPLMMKTGTRDRVDVREVDL